MAAMTDISVIVRAVGWYWLLLCTLLLIGTNSGAASKMADVNNSNNKASTLPNILLVVVDDLGYSDIGYNGLDMVTPNLDKMAAEGVTLSSFYTSPTCTPSRAQLMTGRYNYKTGMQDTVIHSTEPRGVPLSDDFLSDKLRAAGYHTMQIGKWHLGMHQEAYTPLRRGFDQSYGILTGGGDHFQHVSVSQPFTTRGGSCGPVTFQGYNLLEDGRLSDDAMRHTKHTTELYVEKLVSYLDALYGVDGDEEEVTKGSVNMGANGSGSGIAKGGILASKAESSTSTRTAGSTSSKGTANRAAIKTGGVVGKNSRILQSAEPVVQGASPSPWFAYLAFQAVHDPIDTQSHWYESNACSLIGQSGSSDPEAGGVSGNGGDDEDKDNDPIDYANRKVLCGMMAQLDAGMGVIKSKLLEVGDWDNTVVFFMSDNGGINSHGSSNAPFQGSKGQYFEGGVRVPAFVGGGYTIESLRENGVLPYVSDHIVHVTDFHATILELAGYSETDNLEVESNAGDVGRTNVSGGGSTDLDGVDHWGSWISTKEAVRDRVVINLNSELFGSSGAVRMGDYKLMVNPDPKETTIYTKMKERLTSQSYNIPAASVQSIMKGGTTSVISGGATVTSNSNTNSKVINSDEVTSPAKSKAGTETTATITPSLLSVLSLEPVKYVLIDLSSNPGEDISGSCAPKATDNDDGDDWASRCTNLFGSSSPAVSARQRELLAFFNEEAGKMVPTTFVFADDGPLANPALFGGAWVPWRDEDGAPLAMWGGVTLADTSTATSTSPSAQLGSAEGDGDTGYGDSRGGGGGGGRTSAEMTALLADWQGASLWKEVSSAALITGMVCATVLLGFLLGYMAYRMSKRRGAGYESIL